MGKKPRSYMRYTHKDVARTSDKAVNTADLVYCRPLVDHADLFLRFARLRLDVPGPVSWSESLAGYPFIFGDYDYRNLETDRNAEAAVSWATDNGALGLTPGSPPRGGGEPLRSGGDPMGGEADTV